MPTKHELAFDVFPALEGLRFFFARSSVGTKVSLVWVDHEASCHHPKTHEWDDDGNFRKTSWHTYKLWDQELRRWYATAIRCPASLEDWELERLEANEPAGHARHRHASEQKAARE